jgi:hypothetical protein
VWSSWLKIPVSNARLRRRCFRRNSRDEERLARFEREARAVAAVNHPGIAVPYEIGEFHGTRHSETHNSQAPLADPCPYFLSGLATDVQETSLHPTRRKRRWENEALRSAGDDSAQRQMRH